MTFGRIHSRESFGTVEGPGIRYVLFMQGCPMRCLYCHNPDTWRLDAGTKMTAEQVLAEYEHNRAFYKNGGITVTGGEPLLQIDFLYELFSAAKKKKIHTCIDTSGITYNPKNAEYTEKLDALLSVTDLVMLDIKHVDSEAHKRLTGVGNENVIAFARHLAQLGTPLWVRHVVIPGYTDGEDDLRRLGELLATLPNLRALDVLPYHSLGAHKYRELGIEYALEGVPALSVSEAARAKKNILQGIKNGKNSKK